MPRDANGNYDLPSGNPVVSDTVIDTNWANPTMSDLGNEIQDSLSRTGKGGMLSPLRFPDGGVSSPAISFTSEPTTGMYRAANADLRFSVLGVDGIAISNVRVRVFKQLANVDGTATNPAVSFSNALDTGMYLAGDDDVRMSSGGADIMGFNAAYSTLYKAMRGLNGIAANPTYSFTDSIDSGMYLSAAGDCRISAGGIDNIRFLATGAEYRDVVGGTWKPLIEAFQSAVNSGSPNSGFGGFRYTVSGDTLNLFTT